jgi:hypothetical protein
MYDGIAVATMDMQKGVTTANAKIRVKPSTKAQSIMYTAEPYGERPAPAESVPANSPVVVRALAAEKDRVGEWNNYWNLIDVGVHENVWMFGELVKLN